MKTSTTIEFALTISETEARALDALVGYGIDPFLKTFYTHMGKAYLEPYEAGLRDLFNSVDLIRDALQQVDHNRRLLANAIQECQDYPHRRAP